MERWKCSKCDGKGFSVVGSSKIDCYFCDGVGTGSGMIYYNEQNERDREKQQAEIDWGSHLTLENFND